MKNSANPAPVSEITPLSRLDKRESISEYTDDILSKLTDAFFEAKMLDGMTKRELARILDCSDSHVSHVLNGRRQNLTASTIAEFARALSKRPELVLSDIRPKGNGIANEKPQQRLTNQSTEQLEADPTARNELGNVLADSY